MRAKDMPAAVLDIMKQRHSQNKIDAQVLHYRIATKVTQQEFQAGYTQIQEQVNFSLAPFARYLERGQAKIYKEAEGKVSHDSVERRYQINLVVVLRQGKSETEYARYKVTMNRSSIIEITQSDLPVNTKAISEDE
jgi:hypothetical protein